MPSLADTIRHAIVAELKACPHGTRAATVKRLADIYGVSVATLYRIAQRNGAKRPREVVHPEYREWVKVAVALAHKKPGKPAPLDLALASAIKAGELPAAAAAMPLATAQRIVRELGLKVRPKRSHRLAADYPMQALQVDGSGSQYLTVAKALDDGDYLLKLHHVPYPASGYKNKPVGPDRLRVYLYSLWDLCTGYQLARYYIARGENAFDIINFLCWAFAGGIDPRIPLHGLPDDLWSDGGPLKAQMTQDLLDRLGIQFCVGAPYAKERMGGVERTHRMRWSRFEGTLFFSGEDTITLSEVNARLTEYLIVENGQRQARCQVGGRVVSRTEPWVALTNARARTNPLRKLPDNALSTLAVEARRKVDQNGILHWEGTEYELATLHSCWVIARRAVDGSDTVVVEDAIGAGHIAKPYQPRPYGVIAGNPKTALAKLLEERAGLTGAPLYTPAADEASGNLVSLPARSAAPAPLDNPLDGAHYANVDTAMAAFTAIYPHPLTAQHRHLVIERIEQAGFRKDAVRTLALGLTGLSGPQPKEVD